MRTALRGCRVGGVFDVAVSATLVPLAVSRPGCRLWCRTRRAWCYTLVVPTTHPRYTVTDTGSLREQLDRAQRRWPDVEDRRQLLLRLVAAGRESIEREASERATAVRDTAGSLTGIYEPDELERLREDWPA